MDTIFMNSENSKTSKPHVLILKLTNKLDLRIGEKIIALSNLSIYYTWKNIKSSYNNNKFAPRWKIFKIILSIFKKNMEKILINHQYKYMEIKLKIGLHLKLKRDIVLNF